MHPGHFSLENCSLKQIWYFASLLRKFPRRHMWLDNCYIRHLSNIGNRFFFAENVFLPLKWDLPTEESFIHIAWHTLAVKVNPSFPCLWVSDGRLQLRGIFWLIVLMFLDWPIGVALWALYGFLSPLTALIGLD